MTGTGWDVNVCEWQPVFRRARPAKEDRSCDRCLLSQACMCLRAMKIVWTHFDLGLLKGHVRDVLWVSLLTAPLALMHLVNDVHV